MHYKCMRMVGSTVFSEEECYFSLIERNKADHFEIKYFVIGVCTSVPQEILHLERKNILIYLLCTSA